MFGVYFPKTVYDLVPYAYAAVGYFGMSSPAEFGQFSGFLLVVCSLKIMKMRA